MQIKENHNNKKKYSIWQKNTLVTTILACCLTILVLSTVTFVTPCLTSSQLQANSSAKYSSAAANINNNSQIAVFSADSKSYGLTYGEWTARWWQWGYSIPKDINPAYDDTGKNCAQKQNGPVWFLAGTYGHAVNRKCDIPAGKAILFPILNSECSFAEFPKLKTLSELRVCAKTIQDLVITLNATVDGVLISDLQKYRIQSPPFSFTLPQNNILGPPSNVTTQAIADGNWVFLKPLSAGSHKLMFKGGVREEQQQLQTITTGEVDPNNVSSSSTSSFAFPLGWNFETTYDLTVGNNATNDCRHYSSQDESSIIDQRNRITTAAQHNVVKLLADIVRNKLHDTVNLLKITSKHPVIQSATFANYKVKST